MRQIKRVKPFTCPSCGGTNQHPPRGPYVECEACATICDFDGDTARRSPDWYRAHLLEKQLFARHEREFRAAIEAADRERWKAIYRRVLLEQIARCPTMFPSGVRDPAYRDRFVDWLLASLEMLYWEAEPARLSSAMAMIEVPIRNGVADSAAFWRRTDVADKLYAAQERIDRVLGNTPPERFPPGFLRRMNLSLYVQEWLGELAEADAVTLLERTGFHHDYVVAEPTGDYACATCGGTVKLDAGATLVMCPFCRSALRSTDAAPTIGPTQWAALRECDDGLDEVDAKLARLVIADGAVGAGRTIVLQAITLDGRAVEFAARELRPELPFAGFLHAWAELEAERRKVPLESRWLREHAGATTFARDEHELDARLAAMNAPAGAQRAEVVARGPGCALDVVVVADTGPPWTLRLARDDDQRNAELYRRWSHRAG